METPASGKPRPQEGRQQMDVSNLSKMKIAGLIKMAEEMKLARVVTTRHPMGRPLGAAGDHARHRRVAMAALELFDSAAEPTMVELPEPFRAGDRP